MIELGSEKVCLALGYFDSMHLGHRNLISAAKELAQKLNIGCAVATFTNNAYKLFNPEEKQVYTYSERCELLSELCDRVLPMRFDTRLKNCSAEIFLDHLFDKYNISAVVCGYDYLFGEGAKGDAEFLREFCAARNVECAVISKVELDGERVSTTRVKSLLRSGEIEKANAFLGEPFFLNGKVVRGRGAGRMFDIPTANIKLPNSKILPADGVYGTVCVIDGKEYYGATNIGARPTFGLTKRVVETMISDFNENIYDKDIKIKFFKFIRKVEKFDTPAQLSKQVQSDVNWHK